MLRTTVGFILAVAGATAAIASPFRAWYAGHHGTSVRFGDLFDHLTPGHTSWYDSLVLPMAVAVLLTLIGLFWHWRFLIASAGLVVVGITILWLVQQARHTGGLTADSKGSGLGQGVANALGGGMLLLIAAFAMPGRRKSPSKGSASPAGTASAPEPEFELV